MQPKDLIDIALVSVVFFLCLSWLRRNLPPDVSKRTLAVASLAAAVYFLSLQFDLSLFQRLFEPLVLVLLVATVVVYQTDIRRTLDRAFAGPATDRGSRQVVTVLEEAVPELAAQRVGALIALRGREPWSSHVHGGVALEGQASVPLLHSVFDHHTPGHDGALLVEGDVVTRFAVHLPLASVVPDVSRFGGTRHAAALGLAHECDALVIVVSEERGTVSVAEEGRLDLLAEPSDLVRRLRAFYDRLDGQAPAESPGIWRRPGLQTAAASVGLAAVLWFAWIYGPNMVLRTFAVPLVLKNLSDGWALADPLPTTAEVELLGSQQRLAELDSGALALEIDVASLRDGQQEVSLGEDNLVLPPGIELQRVRPTSVPLELRRTRLLDVPIVVPTIGVLPRGLRLVSLRAEPAALSLIVLEGDKPPTYMLTQAVDLRQINADTSVDSRITLPVGTRLPNDERLDVVIDVDVGPPSNEQ
jgi:diadenylate cyclase